MLMLRIFNGYNPHCFFERAGSEIRQYAPLHHLGKGKTNPRSRREVGNIWAMGREGKGRKGEGPCMYMCLFLISAHLTYMNPIPLM